MHNREEVDGAEVEGKKIVEKRPERNGAMGRCAMMERWREAGQIKENRLMLAVDGRADTERTGPFCIKLLNDRKL